MSTPPVQPSNGNESAPGTTVPQYGQGVPQAPVYGQGTPPAPYASPYGSGEPTGPQTIPAQVELSFKMILAAGILSAISSLVLAFTGAPYLTQLFEEAFAAQDQPVPANFSTGIAGTMMIGGIVGAIMSLGLYALVAFPVRKGKNWARILGTVFAVISVFSLFTGLFAFGALYGIMQVIVILLGIAAMVLLYLKPNAPYFSKAPRIINQ